MTKISWKPGTMLAPVPPALISCGTPDNPNVMTAAWTGIIASDPTMTYVSIRPSRYSHEIISKSGEFVINLTNLPLAKAADWCGVKSGRDFDKFKEMGLTASPCSQIKAPQIEEAPVSIECKVKSVTRYGTHDMFLAEVVAVNVDDRYIDESGKLWLEKAGLVAYVHGYYYTLGRQLGKFGFSVEKKPKKSKEKFFEVKDTSSPAQAKSPFANRDRNFIKTGKTPNKNTKQPNVSASQDKKAKGKRIFDDRSPKRFSDERRNRRSMLDTIESIPSQKLKKFSGELKFKKVRPFPDPDTPLSKPRKKHYGKLKHTKD